MPLRTQWAAFCISSVFFAVGTIDAGCGSDSFTGAASTDGGSGEGAATDSGSLRDAGAPGCLTPPTSVPDGDVAFCQAFAEIYSNCGSCETCRQEDVNNCAAYGESFSDAFKTALVTCKDTFQCADLQVQSLGNSPCVADMVNHATPSGAQNAAKTAYCTACPGDAGLDMPCDQFFVSADGGSTPGTAVLYLGDNLATELGSRCANNCGALSYGACELLNLCNVKDPPPKTTCSQGVCK